MTAQVNRSRLIALAAIVLVLSACAAGPNAAVDVAAADGSVAGFWTGLWQGIILPITFIFSLFTENVSVYEVHNTGGWYDFGFVLGAGTLMRGCASRSKRRRSRRSA